LGEPLAISGADRHLALRFGEWLALLAGEDQCEIVEMRELQFGPLADYGAPLPRGLVAPRRPGLVGSLDRALRFGSAHDRYGADAHAVGGVVDLERALRIGVGPLAVDVALLLQQRRVLERDRRSPFECIWWHGESPAEI